MAYTTLAQVQALVAAYTIGASSSVTPAAVAMMMEATSDEIDAILSGHGIATPLATPTSFVNRLSLLAAYGVAAMVLKSAYPAAGGAGSTSAYSFWESRYQAGLKALQTKEGIPTSVLTSSTAGSDATLPSSYFTRNPDEEETLGHLEGAHLFRVGKEW